MCVWKKQLSYIQLWSKDSIEDVWWLIFVVQSFARVLWVCNVCVVRMCFCKLYCHLAWVMLLYIIHTLKDTHWPKAILRGPCLCHCSFIFLPLKMPHNGNAFKFLLRLFDMAYHLCETYAWMVLFPPCQNSQVPKLHQDQNTKMLIIHTTAL